MKNKSLYLFMAAIAIAGIVGIKLQNQCQITTKTSNITLANLEAILGGESSDIESEKGEYEYPKGYTYTSYCQVVIGNIWKVPIRCGSMIVTCPAGGKGCNTVDCPTHPHFNSEKN